jgi:hypothetical protein
MASRDRASASVIAAAVVGSYEKVCGPSRP